MLFPVHPLMCIATLGMLANLCTADNVQYIIYPVKGISSKDSEALESLLNKLAGDASLVYIAS